MCSRMWQLIEAGKTRPLSDAEKRELQKLFVLVALNDARILQSEKRA